MIASSRRRTALIVEEDAELRMLLADILSGKGYCVLQAGNGKVALRLATQHEPDVIVLGVSAPVPQGLSLLDALKQSERTGQIPVVVVGAARDKVTNNEAGRTAAFTQQPFRLATILSHLERVAAN
jgi:response regulator NasT